MPRIESAKKAMRQGRTRHERNRAQQSALRTALKRVRAAATAKQAGDAYRAAARLLDRAARKNLIHPNNAARHKSRLAAVIRKLTDKK
ncbi:MAG TPA: 30S ribosomal protein S20 [Gemmatimonadales bacterium]|nr:30S ribosomal protein S20 [Gemmatimonadales bacterium]